MQTTEAARPAVTEVSDDTFDAVVLSWPRPVLVEFSVSWCGHCHAMELAIEALAGSMPDGWLWSR